MLLKFTALLQQGNTKGKHFDRKTKKVQQKTNYWK